jgi:hypothetical protein
VETLNKRRLLPLLVLLVIVSWFVFKYLLSSTSIPTGSLKFVAIFPSLIYKNRDAHVLPWREDYFSVVNLDRSDSAKLLQLIAGHVCQVLDTIKLKKYELYRIEYMNTGNI